MNGLVHDLDENEYHRHPALSASGAKRLLPPGCPALFKWERDHPVHKDVFDFGSAAHAEVLGVGAQVEWFDAPDWRSKKAQEWRDACRAEGITPVLKREYEQVQAMAVALREHPLAAGLLHPESGAAEVSLFWTDPAHEVERRCRVDWLREPDENGRLLLVDYKSTVSAEPGAIRKSIANYGYHLSAAWYQDMVLGLELAEDVPFLLVFQEKVAPYLVTVVEIDNDALAVGRLLADRALQVFKDCSETDTWPGYVGTDEIPLVSLPPWATRDLWSAA